MGKSRKNKARVKHNKNWVQKQNQFYLTQKELKKRGKIKNAKL